jgi:hypothetical protein
VLEAARAVLPGSVGARNILRRMVNMADAYAVGDALV